MALQNLTSCSLDRSQQPLVIYLLLLLLPGLIIFRKAFRCSNLLNSCWLVRDILQSPFPILSRSQRSNPRYCRPDIVQLHSTKEYHHSNTALAIRCFLKEEGTLQRLSSFAKPGLSTEIDPASGLENPLHEVSLSIKSPAPRSVPLPGHVRKPHVPSQNSSGASVVDL